MATKKHESVLSLPELEKIRLEGKIQRNISVPKLTLGKRLVALRITLGWMEKLTKGKRDKGTVDRILKGEKPDFFENMPMALEVIEKDYEQLLLIVSDLNEQEIQQLELEDLIVILKASWKVNGFAEQVTALGKAVGIMGGAGAKSGSSEPSPSSGTTAAGTKQPS